MKSNRNGINLFIFLALIVVSALLLSIQSQGSQIPLLAKAQSATFSFVSVLQAGVGKVMMPLRTSFVAIIEYGALKDVNRDLDRENQRLKDDAGRVQTLEQENRRLRRLLGFATNSPLETISATVVARPVDVWQSTAIIDKGSKDGIGLDMAVVDGTGLVGKTIAVSNHTAKILLITDKRCAVGVKLAETATCALVEGARGKDLPLMFMDRAVRVKAGDVVVTSGLGGVFPPDLIVGHIGSVVRKDMSVEKQVMLKPAADIARLYEVLVLRNSPPIVPTVDDP